MSFKIAERQTYSARKVSELRYLLSADCQRCIDKERVANIVEDLTNTIKRDIHPVLAGTLCIVEHDSKEYLIDGQHRLAAYIKVLDQLKYDLLICVNVINVTDDAEIETLFRLVNKSVPVAELPDGVRFSDINRVVEHFSRTVNFSVCKTGNPCRPNVHRLAFEQFIGRIKILVEGISDEQIIAAIDTFNKKCSEKTWTFFKKVQGDKQEKIEGYLKRCNGFYLGFYAPDDWPTLIFGKGTLRKVLKPPRAPIPAPLRKRVWEKHIGDKLNGTCALCAEPISFISFHVAHNIADINGGETTVDNLYVVCAACNLSSGRNTFQEMLPRYTLSNSDAVS